MGIFRTSPAAYAPLDLPTSTSRSNRTLRTGSVLLSIVRICLIAASFLLGRRSVTNHESHDTIQLPTIIRKFEWVDDFATRPSNESSAAWESLYPKGGAFFAHAPEVPQKSTLSVFRQLQCLDAIRQAYYLAYDSATAGHKLEPNDMPEMVLEIHVRHCVELLRQTLMCATDRTVEVVDKQGRVTGFGTTHKCANYGALVKSIETWHKENGDNMDLR